MEGLRLAIADPPYLGGALRWHGNLPPPAGPATSLEAWNNRTLHEMLVANLEARYDGWLVAASAASVPVYQTFLPQDVRMCVWVKGNALPTASRITNLWEAAFLRLPDERSAHGSGTAVGDVLTAGENHQEPGCKPRAWVRWALDLLGYRPGDQVDDVFAVTDAASIVESLHRLSAPDHCLFCGAPIIQAPTGRHRRTCSDVCRQRLARQRARRGD